MLIYGMANLFVTSCYRCFSVNATRITYVSIRPDALEYSSCIQSEIFLEVSTCIYVYKSCLHPRRHQEESIQIDPEYIMHWNLIVAAAALHVKPAISHIGPIETPTATPRFSAMPATQYSQWSMRADAAVWRRNETAGENKLARCGEDQCHQNSSDRL
jgi:hypothetical protein